MVNTSPALRAVLVTVAFVQHVSVHEASNTLAGAGAGKGPTRNCHCERGLAGLATRLRGGGRASAQLGGKPLPKTGGRRLNYAPRSGLGQSERAMAARAAKHRKNSKKEAKDGEGWFKKFVRRKHGLIDPKKGERAMVDTSKAKPRPSSVERHAYHKMYNIIPQPKPPKASVLDDLVAGKSTASELKPGDKANSSAPVARWPTQDVLDEILAKLQAWRRTRDEDPATSYLHDTTLPSHVRQTIRLVRAAQRRGDDSSVQNKVTRRHYMREALAALDAGAEINGADPREETECLREYTALQHAALNGDVALARLLLQRGADVAARDAEGESALHHASAIGSLGMLQLLLDAGADPNMCSPRGLTPLHWAARNNHAACAAILLDCGANASTPARPWKDPALRALKHMPGVLLCLSVSVSVSVSLSLPRLLRIRNPLLFSPAQTHTPTRTLKRGDTWQASTSTRWSSP